MQLIRRFSACAVLAEAMEARLANGESIDVMEHACSELAWSDRTRIGISRRARDLTPTLAKYREGRRSWRKTMTIALPIDAALRDRNLLGAALGDIGSWSTWLAALRAAFGLPLNEAQQRDFRAHRGATLPTDGARQGAVGDSRPKRRQVSHGRRHRRSRRHDADA